MIRLGGVELSDDLHLVGDFQNEDVSYTVRELLGGPAVIQVEARETGAELSLVARNSGNSKMGKFCSYQLSELKAICKSTAPVLLEHPDGNFTVYILKFNVTQSDETEMPGPNKEYYGEIILQEA